MSFWDRVLNRNQELVIFDDKNLYDDSSTRTAFKRVAIESVIGMIARTIIQSEFRIKKNGKYVKNQMYYQFNVKPNKNQTASTFWYKVISKLIYDGECLVVKSRANDLLIADDYTTESFSVYEDKFSNVVVGDLQLDGVFKQNEVYFFEYGNNQLSSLIDSLFHDFGELFNRLVEQQMRKGQLRATVDIDSVFAKDDKAQEKIQSFIDKAYSSIRNRSIAIMPQQKGLEYNEKTNSSSSSASVDEINKVTDGFMSLVANAVGMPISLLRGDMADIDSITRNYMRFCIDPIISILNDELNMTSVTQQDYLKGNVIDIKRVAYRDVFDHASAVDKLRSSSVMSGHELREELGLEYSDDPIHDKFILTKNYSDAEEED